MRCSSLGFVVVACALALAGCASMGRTPVYLAPSGGIGIAVISKSPADMAIAGGDAPHGGGTFVGGRAGGSIPSLGFALVALVAIPFVATYHAIDGAIASAECQRALDSAYPDASNRFHGVVEREIKLEDLRDAFARTLHVRTTSPIAQLESPPTEEFASREQRLVAEAAEKALAYLLVISPRYFGLGPLQRDCAMWAVGTDLSVSLWSVADRKVVAGPLRIGPYVNAHLSDLPMLLDQPGVLRARLAENLELAAGFILEQRRFVLAP